MVAARAQRTRIASPRCGTAAAGTASGRRGRAQRSGGGLRGRLLVCQRELHRLGLAGGARGEQHGVHRGGVELGAGIDLSDQPVHWLPHDHVGPGGRGLPALLGTRQPRVERSHGGADSRGGVHQGGQRAAGCQRGGHAPALGHPQRRQPARPDAGLGVELRVGEGPVGAHHRRVVGARARRCGQPLSRRPYRTSAPWPPRTGPASRRRARSRRRPTGSRPASTRTSARRPLRGSPRSRSTGPRCATRSARRR